MSFKMSESSIDSVKTYNDKCIYKHKIRDICANIPKINITEQLVYEQLKEIPDNLVKGPDNIPNCFIKRCAHQLLKPITNLLYISINEGKTPSIWKCSYVRPIFKSGNKMDVKNYRGVAIHCCIPKLLDSIIASHFNTYLNNILPEHQHGFVRGKSTTTNLAEFTHRIIQSLNTNKQVDAIYIDISKAFDSVDTFLLIHKLKIMNVDRGLSITKKAIHKTKQQEYI